MSLSVTDLEILGQGFIAVCTKLDKLDMEIQTVLKNRSTAITVKVNDMPKLYTPFVRIVQDGRSIVTPEIREEYRWVFDPDKCIAVDKLDGTDVSVIIQNCKIVAIYNRTNRIDIFGKGTKHFIEAIYNALENGYIHLDTAADGQYFGELIGPKLQGNPYKLDKHLWVPFDYLRSKYVYKFWNEALRELYTNPVDDKIIFDFTDKTFQNLWSIYKRARKVEGKPEDVNKDTKFENSLAAEGIVFYKRNSDPFEMIQVGLDMIPANMCKLRRDCFEFYKGIQHGAATEI